MLTLHVPVPVQSPLQPVNTQPVAGCGVSVTLVPAANAAEQVVPQLIPAGWLVTVPLPVTVTLSENVVFWFTTCTSAADVLPEVVDEPP
jgi:hypothetical protein